MRLNVTLLFILLFFAHIGWAQTASAEQHYTILFKSGTYTPAVETLSIDSVTAQWSANTKWYGAIQFFNLPSDEIRKELSAAGISMVGYVPNYTYLVVVNGKPTLDLLKRAGVRSVFALEVAHKMEPLMMNGLYPAWAEVAPDQLDVSVEMFEPMTALSIQEELAGLKYEWLSQEPQFNRITIRIPKSQLAQLANVASVLWIEAIAPPVKEENVPGKNLHRSNTLTDGSRTLTGNNIKMGIWDGGVAGPHLDFAGRLTVMQTGTASDHGTHVAGTMAGAGSIDPYARGMAPKATIFGYDYNGSVNSEIATSIVSDQIVISQHSYGYGDAFVNCTSKDPYNTNSREQDLNVYNYPYFLHVHSAGNSQAVCSGGWGTTTGKAAKNVLVVANVSATEVINSSSSFGPVQDGRLKPEISADGVDVYSSLPNNAYTGGYTGTSMATPVVSGVSAQLYERYVQLVGINPSASLLKAVLCNTAKDIGNAGPDYKHGYGVLNGLRAVKTIEAANYVVGNVSTGGTATVNVTVPTGATRIKVMLCWTDYAAVANANPALVNDLDLTLSDPSAVVYNPWVLSAASPSSSATRNVDHLNNMEQVTIDNPVAGNYTVQVSGFAVPFGPQEYSITWVVEVPHIELTYPNGGEKIAPGSTQTIHWDQAGLTGTKTIQYSINGGSTWTNISTSVAATASWYNWVVSAIGGNKVLIRVTNGTFTDDSDNSFNILGVASGFSIAPGCVSGEVKASWSAVAGATHYAIVKMDTTNGNWDTVATDIATTTTSLLGLTEGTYAWLSVVAKNNTTFSIGQRALAQNFLIPSYSSDLTIQSVSSSKATICAGDNTALTLNATQSKSPFSGYQFATSTGNSLVSMAGATTVLSSGNDDDPTVLPVDIGFTFNLGGVDYSKFSVSPDGWILLGNTTAVLEYTNAVVSTSNVPRIYPYWDDVATGSTGNVKTLLQGTAPNRTLIVQWFVTIPRSTSGAANATFQALLYESTNTIEFRYGTMGSTTSASASSGITINGTTFRSITFSTNTQSAVTANNSNTTPPSSGRMYTFSVPPVRNVVWSPSTYLDTIGGTQVMAMNVAATTVYNLTVTSAMGCSETYSYTMPVNPKPVVGYSVNHALQAINNQSFVFNDTTAGTGNTRVWSFGDGNTSTTNPVTKTYGSTGQYTVKLKVSSTIGCSDSIQKIVKVLQAAPTLSASALTFTNNATTSVQLNWVNGNGAQRIVLMKSQTAVTTILKPGSALSASATFGLGALQSDNSYVVYAGTGNTVTVTGLTPGQTYHVAVVEFNIDAGIWVYQGGSYLTGSNTNIPLPVTWLSLSAQQQSPSTIEVNWSTAAEVNNDYFEVLRSEDAQSWLVRGRVEGAGNSNVVKTYTFMDVVNNPTPPSYYYTIKQVDYDGASKLSSVVQVQVNAQQNSAVDLFPNPAKTGFVVTHSYGENTTLELIKADGFGGLVLDTYSSGTEIDVRNLPAGLYLVRLTHKGKALFTDKLYITH